MKIIFMGTPDFAVGALQAIIDAGHEVTLVVTQPDREKGRGKEVQFTPVKECALAAGIEVFQPQKIKTEQAIAELKKHEADLFVVAAFGQILSQEILDMPKYGCVNIHASLLPAYRGAAPIQWAILDGLKETGVTIMHMAEGMDTGDMLATAETQVEDKTTEYLHVELAQLGAKLLIETLPKIADGSLQGIKQDESKATYAPMVFKDQGVIDYNKSAEEICCLVRGFNSWPTASTKYNGEVMKVHAVKVSNGSGKPGEVLKAEKGVLEVACKGGSVEITRLQMPGKKAMDAGAFLLGNKIEIGTILG